METMNRKLYGLIAAILVLLITGLIYWQRMPNQRSSFAKQNNDSSKPSPPSSLSNRKRTPAAPMIDPLWITELEKGPLAFSWTETLRGEPIHHHGGLLFVKKHGRVYSRAWFARAKTVRPWPPVEGIGSLAKEGIRIVYRSASELPAHEFYFVECNFEFSSDASNMTVRFEQQAQPADPGSDNHAILSPGQAMGQRIHKFDSTVSNELTLLRSFVNRTRESDGRITSKELRCSLLPYRQAKPGLYEKYKSKEYYFCCEGCRTVFKADPLPFLKEKR